MRMMDDSLLFLFISMYMIDLLKLLCMFIIQDVEELMGLPPEKVLLKWMNFHLKKAGYEKQVTNFSSDVKVTESSLI